MNGVPMKFDYSKTINEQLSTFEYYKDRYCSYELQIMRLQQENKQLKEELKAVNKGLRKVLSKRKKWKHRYYKEKMKNRRAKSYIKNNYHLNWYVESNYKDELLQILDKGESDE